MGVIRKIADRIELYDPRTGERFFHYDETSDEISADKPLNAGSVNTDRASIGETSTRIFSTDQTIPDQSVEQVNFDSIADDNLDAADTDNDRITIPRDGQYDIQFYGRAYVDGSDNTNRSRCGILRNGNLIRETSNVLSGDFVRSEVQAVILGVELSAGDHIAVEVKNFSIGDSYSFDGSGDERGPILEVSKSG